MKTCSICGLEKEENEFPCKNRRQCKKCLAERKRNYKRQKRLEYMKLNGIIEGFRIKPYNSNEYLNKEFIQVQVWPEIENTHCVLGYKSNSKPRTYFWKELEKSWNKTFIGDFKQFKKGIVIMHLCDNLFGPCMNWEHIKLGTYKENNQDCLNKKRSALCRKEFHEKIFLVNLKKLRKDNKLGIKGVYECYEKTPIQYQAKIGFKGKCYHLGFFPTKLEAAKVYNEAVLKFYGDSAYLNDLSKIKN